MSTNRRNFLALSAALTAGISTRAFAIPTEQPKKWDQEYDLVIVGAGGAGLAAAVEAVKQGASAIIVEKVGVIGGSSALCGGKFAVSETDEQKAKGIKDTDKTFYEDMLEVGQHQNNPELVKVLVEESKNQYNFITKELGIKPFGITAAAGMSQPRGHAFKPSEVLMAMADYVTKRGTKIVTNTAAERLTWDTERSRISGVKCKTTKGTSWIGARKAVILTSGGFNRNPELLKKFVPAMANAMTIAGIGTTGDGLKMAMAYGADITDMSYIKATYGFTPDATTIDQMAQVYYGGAVMVNKHGKRFVNESLSYKLLGDLALSQPDGISYLVFDEPIRKRQIEHRSQDKALFGPIDEGKKPNYLFVADTLEEAAKQAGLPVKDLMTTIKRYNEDVTKNGVDSAFNRSSLTAKFGKPVPIEKGPFYIMPTTAALIGTYCGLVINAKAQVIDVFNEPIPSLYAAGEITGGIHGAAYMTGTAWGKAMAFGRRAARCAIKG